MKHFPEGFYWGASTASYQVEGYNENTDWAAAAKAGRVPAAGVLADHYHRYEEDFDIAQKLSHNAHRFSIEWARIEPYEGAFDEVEVEHYKTVLRALRKRKITPFVTLWHFTLPQWLSESGGCERSDFPELFARYCGFVVEQLGDLCMYYSTINEPNVYATHSYLYGAWPPFRRMSIFGKPVGHNDAVMQKANPDIGFKHIFEYLRVVKHLARAHNQAYDAIKKANTKALVSVVKHVHYFHANANPFNKIRAFFMSYFQTHHYIRSVRNKIDIIGLNYYRHTMYGDKKEYMYTDMGWKINPSGIYGALKMLKGYKKPVIIAEAGVADRDDDIRAEYISVQVAATHKAIEEGVNVIGHMYWSLMDNYEWSYGIEKCFGLVEIDYQTLQRKVRPSAHVYRKIIENNGIL